MAFSRKTRRLQRAVAADAKSFERTYLRVLVRMRNPDAL